MPTPFPDLLPMGDAQNDFGSPTYRWRILYAVSLSDGQFTIPLSDIATRSDIAQMSVLPLVSSLDNGKFLGVAGGKWAIVDTPPGILPFVTEDDNDKYLMVYGGGWRPMYVSMLPPVTVVDNGFIMRVVEGRWVKHKPPPLLPVVTEDDDGKILQVFEGAWTAVAPPSNVLPLLTLADHGVILVARNGMWRKELLEMANILKPGLMPKLPGSAGRVLAGNNAWVAMPTGASGQWRIGDVRTTLRPVEYGWLAADGTAIQFSDEYKALYMALGGTEADWTAQVPITLPTVERGQVRYLPDSQATADMGIIFTADGHDDPSARLHFEMEVYEEPHALDPVLTMDTHFKERTMLEFTNPLAILKTSSAPGWYWYNSPLDIWQLFDVNGEVATPSNKSPVLVDLAEVGLTATQRQRLVPGSYYVRWRQLAEIGGSTQYGSWHWQRILTTGGMNSEKTQLIKAADIFSTGQSQRWTMPVVGAQMYLVSARGLFPEGPELTVSGLDIIADEGSMRGARISVMVQGYIRRNEEEVDPQDWFSVLPQYTNALPKNQAVSFTEIPGVPEAPGSFIGAYSALAFNAGNNSGRNPNRVMFYGMGTGLTYNLDNNTMEKSTQQPTQDLVNGASASFRGDGTYDYYWRTPPTVDLSPRRWTLSGPVVESPIVYPGANEWAKPLFTKAVAISGQEFWMPGEAPGVWDVTNNTLIPLPAGTIFKGSKAVVVGADGCVYCMPRFTWTDIENTKSTGMLRFDPQTREITYITLPWELGQTKTDASGWYQGFCIRDGKLLFVPCAERYFVVVDPSNDSVVQTTGGAIYPLGSKWRRSAVLADGTIAGFGTDVTNYTSMCFRFNPDTYKITTFTFPKPINAAIRASVVLDDGSVMMAAYTATAGTSLYVAHCGTVPYVPGTTSPLINAR